jgi:hypothetical protein
MLTPPQQQFVKEHSGRDMEWVDVPDEDGEFTRSMGERSPEELSRIALRQAEAQNDWDAQYNAYLLALAEWQDAPDESPADAAAQRAEQDAEAMAAAIAAFYAEEAQALEAARAEALDTWDPKGKKRKKAAAIAAGEEVEEDDE